MINCSLAWLTDKHGVLGRRQSAGPEGRSGGRSEARSAERRPERSLSGPAVPPVWFQFFHFFISWKHRAEYLKFQFFDFRGSWIPPERFQLFFSTFMNTTNGFQVFSSKYLWVSTKISKQLMNIRSQNKKICAVYVEILFWWYFGQKCSWYDKSA